MKRMDMRLLPMVALAGMLGVASHGTWAQEPTAAPGIVVRKQDLTPPPSKTSNLPVFNVRMKGELTVGKLVQFVRDEISKDKSTTYTVNIIVGAGVAELKAPADLDLVNITPVRLFEAIASVEQRLAFQTLVSAQNETTISLLLRPNARDKATASEIKLRVFRLPTPPKDLLEADPEKREARQHDAMMKMRDDIGAVMSNAAELRAAAGGTAMSKSFSFRIHPSTRTVLVTGTVEDLDVAQEVLTALGATASTAAARGEDPNTTKPRSPF
jgi:hypothetical protein